MAEHCCRRSRVLRRPGLWRQHQGGGDPSRPDGDDRLCEVLLHQGPRLTRHLPGELWHRRPHHNLLRWTQPQDWEGVRWNRQSTSLHLSLLANLKTLKENTNKWNLSFCSDYWTAREWAAGRSKASRSSDGGWGAPDLETEKHDRKVRCPTCSAVTEWICQTTSLLIPSPL